MILSNQEIEQRAVARPALISPFIARNVRLSSYDLTIGEEIYSGKNGTSSTVHTETLQSRQAFTIPAHGVCFILSEETITLPHDITAKVSLRMSLVYRGLILTSQPPFDPGYVGKVIMMVHNLSSEPINLQRGDRIVTMELMQVVNPTLPTATTPSPQTHRSVGNLVGQLPGPVRSSLITISEKASRAQERVAWLSVHMISFVGLIATVLAVPGFFSFSGLTDRLDDQTIRIESMQKTIDNQAVALAKLQMLLRVENAGSTAITSDQKTKTQSKK